MYYVLEPIPRRYRLKAVWTWVDGIMITLGGLFAIGLITAFAQGL